MGETKEQPERRGLAGPVGADEPDPAAWHLDGEVVDRRHRGIPLGEPLDAQQGVAVARIHWRRAWQIRTGKTIRGNPGRHAGTTVR
jgi:hypothetical protein